MESQLGLKMPDLDLLLAVAYQVQLQLLNPSVPANGLCKHIISALEPVAPGDFPDL
jgi:hypothetical protein